MKRSIKKISMLSSVLAASVLGVGVFFSFANSTDEYVKELRAEVNERKIEPGYKGVTFSDNELQRNTLAINNAPNGVEAWPVNNPKFEDVSSIGYNDKILRPAYFGLNNHNDWIQLIKQEGFTWEVGYDETDDQVDVSIVSPTDDFWEKATMAASEMTGSRTGGNEKKLYLPNEMGIYNDLVVDDNDALNPNKYYISRSADKFDGEYISLVDENGETHLLYKENRGEVVSGTSSDTEFYDSSNPDRITFKFDNKDYVTGNPLDEGAYTLGSLYVNPTEDYLDGTAKTKPVDWYYEFFNQSYSKNESGSDLKPKTGYLPTESYIKTTDMYGDHPEEVGYSFAIGDKPVDANPYNDKEWNKNTEASYKVPVQFIPGSFKLLSIDGQSATFSVQTKDSVGVFQEDYNFGNIEIQYKNPTGSSADYSSFNIAEENRVYYDDEDQSAKNATHTFVARDLTPDTNYENLRITSTNGEDVVIKNPFQDEKGNNEYPGQSWSDEWNDKYGDIAGTYLGWIDLLDSKGNAIGFKTSEYSTPFVEDSLKVISVGPNSAKVSISVILSQPAVAAPGASNITGKTNYLFKHVDYENVRIFSKTDSSLFDKENNRTIFTKDDELDVKFLKDESNIGHSNLSDSARDNSSASDIDFGNAVFEINGLDPHTTYNDLAIYLPEYTLAPGGDESNPADWNVPSNEIKTSKDGHEFSEDMKTPMPQYIGGLYAINTDLDDSSNPDQIELVWYHNTNRDLTTIRTPIFYVVIFTVPLIILILIILLALILRLLVLYIRSKGLNIYGDVRASIEHQRIIVHITNAKYRKKLWNAHEDDISLIATGVEVPATVRKSDDVPGGFKITYDSLLGNYHVATMVMGAIKYDLFELAIKGEDKNFKLRSIKIKDQSKFAHKLEQSKNSTKRYSDAKEDILSRIHDKKLKKDIRKTKDKIVAGFNINKSTSTRMRYELLYPENHPLVSGEDFDPRTLTMDKMYYVYNGDLYEKKIEYIGKSGTLFEYDVLDCEPGTIYTGWTVLIDGGDSVVASASLFGRTRDEDEQEVPLNQLKLAKPKKGEKKAKWKMPTQDSAYDYLTEKMADTWFGIIVKKHYEEETGETISIEDAKNLRHRYKWIK